MADDRAALAQRARFETLVLAASDMFDVREAALYLADDSTMPWRTRRALETGIVVSYARAFSGSQGRPKLSPPSTLTPEQLNDHRELLEQRRKLYAHSDATSGRGLVELMGDDWRDRLAENFLSEQWLSPPPEHLRDIAQLANANLNTFSDEAEQLRLRLVSPEHSARAARD